MADKREQSAAWDSEKKLDTEEKSLIGDEAEDRNLTGSTTYVTLPDQGDQSSQKSGGKNSDNSSHDKNNGNKDNQSSRGNKA